MRFLPRHTMVMMLWLLLECSFMSCEPTARFFCPCRISSSTCAIDVICRKQYDKRPRARLKNKSY
jgi:hypothetical protein